MIMGHTAFVTILCSVIGSSAVFGFMQFMISRYDKKHDKYGKILDQLSKLRKDIFDIRDEISTVSAVNARIRILQASDQIRRGTKMSEEYYNQINDDITTYNQYCDVNPDFKNNKAVHAVNNINRAYEEALQNDNFL